MPGERRLAELAAVMMAHHFGAPGAPAPPPAPYDANARHDLQGVLGALSQAFNPHSSFNVYHR
jgi:hypothetical protein